MTPEGEGLLLAGESRKTVRTWRADAALAGNTVIWGSTFVLVQSALKDVSPIVFLSIRFSIATAALALLFRSYSVVPAHARRADCRRVPVRRLPVSNRRAAIHHSIQVRVYHRPGDSVGTFAHLPRLSDQAAHFRVGRCPVRYFGYGIDDSARRFAAHRTRGPFDLFLRGSFCSAHHRRWALFRADQFRVFVLYAGGVGRGPRPLDFLVDRKTGYSPDSGGHVCPCNDRTSGHRASLHGAGMGPAAHYSHTHGSHLFARARGGVVYVLLVDGRTAFAAGRHRGGTDINRNIAGRAETCSFHRTSIGIETQTPRYNGVNCGS